MTGNLNIKLEFMYVKVGIQYRFLPNDHARVSSNARSIRSHTNVAYFECMHMRTRMNMHMHMQQSRKRSPFDKAQVLQDSEDTLIECTSPPPPPIIFDNPNLGRHHGADLSRRRLSDELSEMYDDKYIYWSLASQSNLVFGPTN